MTIRIMKEKIKYVAGRLGSYLNDFPNRDKIAEAMDYARLTVPLAVTAAVACVDPKDVLDVYSNIAELFNLHSLSGLINVFKDIEPYGIKTWLISRGPSIIPIAIPTFAAMASLENTIAHFRGIGGDGLSNKLIEYSRK